MDPLQLQNVLVQKCYGNWEKKKNNLPNISLICIFKGAL